ncbi:MAG: cytochrome c-type biogenesis protein CcmH [Chloroflexi bacterium]|nr:cytochrome c-type biogenesis protein CcmH [Chloroflexota bacterium]
MRRPAGLSGVYSEDRFNYDSLRDILRQVMAGAENTTEHGMWSHEMKNQLRVMLYTLTIALVLAALWVVKASAQNPTPTDDEVNRIAHQLYCPVCENTPLDFCPTEACRQWRDLIRQQLSQGWTEDQIKQYFAEQYGARVLAEPPRTGLNWLVYILPPVIILAGAFLLFRMLRAWTKPPAASSAAGSAKEAAQDDYVARLEEELKKRK